MSGEKKREGQEKSGRRTKSRLKKREKRHLSLTKKERRNRCPFRSTVQQTKETSGAIVRKWSTDGNYEQKHGVALRFTAHDLT